MQLRSGRGASLAESIQGGDGSSRKAEPAKLRNINNEQARRGEPDWIWAALGIAPGLRVRLPFTKSSQNKRTNIDLARIYIYIH